MHVFVPRTRSPRKAPKAITAKASQGSYNGQEGWHDGHRLVCWQAMTRTVERTLLQLLEQLDRESLVSPAANVGKQTLS